MMLEICLTDSPIKDIWGHPMTRIGYRLTCGESIKALAFMDIPSDLVDEFLELAKTATIEDKRAK